MNDDAARKCRKPANPPKVHLAAAPVLARGASGSVTFPSFEATLLVELVQRRPIGRNTHSTGREHFLLADGNRRRSGLLENEGTHNARCSISPQRRNALHVSRSELARVADQLLGSRGDCRGIDAQRCDRQLVRLVIQDEVEATDMAAVRHLRSRPIFVQVMLYREITRGTAPRHGAPFYGIATRRSSTSNVEIACRKGNGRRRSKSTASSLSASWNMRVGSHRVRLESERCVETVRNKCAQAFQATFSAHRRCDESPPHQPSWRRRGTGPSDVGVGEASRELVVANGPMLWCSLGTVNGKCSGAAKP